MSLGVVGHGSTTALLERQAGLSAIQGLNLTLFIHAQHDRLLGWVQIESDHVRHFFQELRVARQFESLNQMRLQIVGLPDGVDRGLTYSLTGGHGSTTPMGHAFRLGLQGRIHNGGYLIYVVDRFSSPPRGNGPNT